MKNSEEFSELLVQSAEETFGVKYVNTVSNMNNVQRKQNNGSIVNVI